MTLLTRAGVLSDLEAVVGLDRSCFGAEAWSRESWTAEFTRADRSVLLAAGPSVVGYVALIVPEFARDPVDLTRIAVAPGVRRTGIAARLLTEALDSVAGRVVLLEVAEGNDAALGLYQAHGFEVIGRRGGYYGGQDALIMRRDGSERDGSGRGSDG